MQLSNNKIKDKVVQIRVSEDERNYIKEKASEKGLTVSELIKKALDKYLEEV